MHAVSRAVTDRGDGWLTRKDAAVLAGCSEDTIKRAVRAQRLSTRVADNGAVLVWVEDLVRIGKVAADTLPGTGDSAQTLAELRRVEADLAATRERLAEVTGRLDERREVIDQLKAQLTVKDRQLDALTKSLSHLAAAVADRRGGAA